MFSLQAVPASASQLWRKPIKRGFVCAQLAHSLRNKVEGMAFIPSVQDMRSIKTLFNGFSPQLQLASAYVSHSH